MLTPPDLAEARNYLTGGAGKEAWIRRASTRATMAECRSLEANLPTTEGLEGTVTPRQASSTVVLHSASSQELAGLDFVSRWLRNSSCQALGLLQFSFWGCYGKTSYRHWFWFFFFFFL